MPRSVPLTLLAALLLALAVLSVLRQANPLYNFPSLDNGYYLYIGQQILAGKTPYVDMWESKPPGIFYVNALGLWLGRGSRWGVWALEFAALFSAAGVSFLTLRKIYGFLPALLGTLTALWGVSAVLPGRQPDRRILPALQLSGCAGLLALASASWPAAGRPCSLA